MLRIVSLTGSQVLIIGLFSRTDTHTHTHTHNGKHKEMSFSHPGKKKEQFFSVFSVFVCLQQLLYNM